MLARNPQPLILRTLISTLTLWFYLRFTEINRTPQRPIILLNILMDLNIPTGLIRPLRRTMRLPGGRGVTVVFYPATPVSGNLK